MGRKPRIVVPNHPHHVTHRGTRRQNIFFRLEDYQLYKNILAQSCIHYGVEIWAYCLMPNHIHLIAVPKDIDGLKMAIGRAHHRYALILNRQNDWKGHLWQGRFLCKAMEEDHFITAARYIELNPVRAKIVNRPEEFEWSSACAHLNGVSDALVNVDPLLSIVPDWQKFLEEVTT